jgi:3-dehydroquinate synthase
MKTLRLALGERSYPIYIGSGLLSRPELVRPTLAGSQVMLVSNETVAPLYLDQARKAFEGLQVDTVVLPDGEEYKNLDVLNRIFDALLERRHGRQTTLVALGGGVVGDITGFAAACYQRGVGFIQIPTTLLAQVDASVGGKTGVNHPLGKNMIGAFHQPRCVVADTQTLDTLDERQLRAGIAEVIKYGLIRDPVFFAWLEAHMGKLLARDPEALSFAIERACQNKAEVVAADERESGQRALLNLGHTFGHAIETGLGYGRWLHGEAVAAGMVLAAELSDRHGWISAGDAGRIRDLLMRAGLPCARPEGLKPARMLELMAVDKKVAGGRIRLVLLKGLGRAVVTDAYDAALLTAVLGDSTPEGASRHPVMAMGQASAPARATPSPREQR